MHRTGLRARPLQKVFKQTVKILYREIEIARQALNLRTCKLIHVIDQQFRKRRERVERPPEVVTDNRKELILRGVQLLQLRILVLHAIVRNLEVSVVFLFLDVRIKYEHHDDEDQCHKRVEEVTNRFL